MTMADINYEALVEVFKGNLWEAERSSGND